MKTTDIAEKHRTVWANHGFKNLLVWLLVYLLIGPVLESVPYAATLMRILLTVVLFSAVYAVNQETRLLSVAIAIMAATLTLYWLGDLGVLGLSPPLFLSLLVSYLGVLAYSFVRHIFAARRVTANVVCAALCLYLVLGLLWGTLFSLLEWWAPNSFAGGLLDQASRLDEKRDCFNYLSFVTLSTLGYGDIAPQTHPAAALCQAEAILGQFFTVVLVARLVGLQIAHEGTGGTPEIGES